MRHAALANELQHVGASLAEHELAVRGAAVPARIQIWAQPAGEKPVGVEPILVDVQRGVLTFEITDPIATHSLSQDQILRPGWRPDRVGLHELHVRQRRSQGPGGSGQ